MSTDRRSSRPHRKSGLPGAAGKKPGPRTDWGGVADWYDELVGDAGSDYHRHVVLPGTMRLLDPREGERVLDVACGQGVLCRMLHKKGARPTGVDAAASLIEAAKQRSDPAIQFRMADARQLAAIPELAGHFHAAACLLAIANIDPIRPVFEGIAHSLVADGSGRVVVVTTHPAFRGPAFSQWGWDEKNMVQYRRVDRYLLPRKHPIVTHPGRDPKGHTWTFHRPISAYVKALRQAGLLVDAIEEWTSHKTSTSGPRAPAENLARNEIPLFLAIRAVKPR